ncbi:MAG: SDR family NAD(P)-dependent oxidoreductase [Thermoanaerobaculales bacterium]|nr:SDR family NAD(P)-dependent oxidoreductase [Thermoanaerobaculales bacterium]
MLKGQKVLVTGADGFIGSHLVERLVELGAQVRAFCLYNSNGSLGWLDEASPEVRASIERRLGDIRDARFVEEACKGIDVVFHLAALIAIPYSYRAAESYVDTNVKGTLNVLEAARRQGCKRVVHTSTSEVYGTPASVPIRESHPLQGQSPYSASKIAADKLCEAYHCSFDVPVVTLRPFNTYGPRQSMRAVLPTILVQLLSGRRVVHLGNLDPRRDLTFVSDTVEGFVCAAETGGIEGELIQLGTGRTVSIGELFETACRALGVDARVEVDEGRVRPGKSEVMVLVSDPARAKDLLGWAPSVELEHGLAKTAAWLKERHDLFDPDRYHV